MKRRWRLPIWISLVIFMTLPTGETASAGEVPAPTDNAPWSATEREEWLEYARATWRSFESMTGSNGLTADRLQVNSKGEWKPSGLTSPTDIAAYLWSTLAARILGLISDQETDQKLGLTLRTLDRMDRSHGFYFNFYDVPTGRLAGVGGEFTHRPRPFLSSVDNAWLAAALTMIANDRPTLREQANALLRPMDFGFFYVPFDPADPVNKPGLFHGGYFTDDQTFSTFYGMLNTEPRIISYLAIARKQVPPEHYYRLYRTFPPDRGHQTQTPRGEIRTYLGVPVFEGHYRYRGFDLVPSWGGSMFEALMVPLFIPEEKWAPQSWGINHPLYVRAQIEQGMIVRRYGFWGFSPSWTPKLGYQTYGVSEIGTEVDGYKTYEIPHETKPKRGQPTDHPCFEGIVTPHASFLALPYAPRQAFENLRALKKAFPIFTPTEGFHDSVDITSGDVSRCVLALDQGMILAAIANTLVEDSIRKTLCQGPIEEAIRPLIAPEHFTAADH